MRTEVTATWNKRTELTASWVKPREFTWNPLTCDITTITCDSTLLTCDRTKVEWEIVTVYDNPRYKPYIQVSSWLLLEDSNWNTLEWQWVHDINILQINWT